MVKFWFPKPTLKVQILLLPIIKIVYFLYIKNLLFNKNQIKILSKKLNRINKDFVKYTRLF